MPLTSSSFASMRWKHLVKVGVKVGARGWGLGVGRWGLGVGVKGRVRVGFRLDAPPLPLTPNLHPYP